MPDNTVLTRLDLLDQYVNDLRQAQPRNFEAYRSDKMLRRYTERMLHMAVDTCVQIGIAVLTQEGLRSPENYHDIFIVLGEHGILPREMVDCMTALVEFRNVLVYEHSTVDDAMVYGFAKKRLNDFVDFSNAVRGYWREQAIDIAFHSEMTSTQSGHESQESTNQEQKDEDQDNLSRL